MLADVRAAVTDWRAMQENMHAQAEAVADGEGKALLHWLADGAMTLLGYEVERPGEKPSERLGIMRLSGRADRRGRLRGRDPLFRAGRRRCR